METLYAGFQKRRKSLESEEGGGSRETAERREMDDKARRLKKEEAKVRTLNRNGRVDFSIQESVNSSLLHLALSKLDAGYLLIRVLLGVCLTSL